MKGFIPLIGVAIVAVVFIALLTVPGLSESITSSVMGTPVSCNDAPYNVHCVCGDNEDKIRVNTLIWTYSCVASIEPLPYSFPMDINDPDFNNMAFAYAVDYLEANFYDCNTILCGDPMWKEIYPMTSVSGDKGYVECLEGIDPTTAQSYWRVVFMVEDGSMSLTMPPYCTSK